MTKQQTVVELQTTAEELEEKLEALQTEQNAIPGKVRDAVTRAQRKEVEALRARQEVLADEMYETALTLGQTRLDHIQAHRAEQKQEWKDLGPQIEDYQRKIQALQAEVAPLIERSRQILERDKLSVDRERKIKRQLDALIRDEVQRIQTLSAPVVRSLRHA